MSHYIEKYKRVVTFPYVAPPGENTWRNGECLLFLTSGSSNNVSPRTYDWDVCAMNFGHSEWSGEIMLPQKLWEMAYCADGGMIKPHGRDQAGVSYIKSWKQAVKDRFPMNRNESLLWHPRLSIWHWKSDRQDDDAKFSPEEINQGAAVFSPKYEHQRQNIHAAFKRLFPDPLRGSNSNTIISTPPEMSDAVYLWMNREHLPCSFHLCHSEDCAFLQRGKPEQVELLAA